MAIEYVARYNNVDIDRESLRVPGGEAPPPAALVEWVRQTGLWAKAIRIKWSQLMKLEVSSPVVLLLKDGSAAILTTVDIARDVVWLKDPRGASGDPPVAVDELRLSQVWAGETMLVRVDRGYDEDTAPFNLAWLGRIVWQEKKLLRQIFYRVDRARHPVDRAGADGDDGDRQGADAPELLHAAAGQRDRAGRLQLRRHHQLRAPPAHDGGGRPRRREAQPASSSSGC